MTVDSPPIYDTLSIITCTISDRFRHELIWKIQGETRGLCVRAHVCVCVEGGEYGICGCGYGCLRVLGGEKNGRVPSI